jgi:hypothetical protein
MNGHRRSAASAQLMPPVSSRVSSQAENDGGGLEPDQPSRAARQRTATALRSQDQASRSDATDLFGRAIETYQSEAADPQRQPADWSAAAGHGLMPTIRLLSRTTRDAP